MPRYCIPCDDHLDERVRGLAVRYGLTEQEVLVQLVEHGLQELDHGFERQ